mmetsp:Transcript_4966/g.16635  ORF Transcript_4966/g.16635 Transcript_4966/m.16635 type:complete len:248 (-) Transcript_4966:503-1246(-)
MPASVHTALDSAPEASVIMAAIFLRSMPRMRFILREWMRRMSARASSLGLGNSILRSMRPGRRRAESRMSMRLVAMITLMFWDDSKPSSWLRSSSMVRCTSRSPESSESKRLVPTASISSMNMMAGCFSLASANASRTSLAPSPMNICTSCGPASLRKHALVCAAQARAMRVLPTPGGPNMSTPFGGLMPMFSKRSLCVKGSTMASTSSCTCLSRPPMSLYCSVGFSSTSIAFTRESYSAGRASRMR